MAGFEQNLMQIGAMDQRVRVTEFLAERITERNAGDFLAGDRIHHDEVVRKHRERADRRDKTQDSEHPEHVGAKLDAGTDLLELGRLLDDLRGDTLARQRQRRSEPADAAADDDDLLIFPIAHGGSVGGIVEGRPLPTSVAGAWRTGQGRSERALLRRLIVLAERTP